MTDYYIQRKNKEFMTITKQENNSFLVTHTSISSFGAGEFESPMIRRVYKKLRNEHFEKMTKDEDFALYYLMDGYNVE